MFNLRPREWFRDTPYYVYGQPLQRRSNRAKPLAVCLLLLLALPAMYQIEFHSTQAKLASQQPAKSQPPVAKIEPTPIVQPTTLSNPDELQQLLNDWQASHQNHQWSVSVIGLGIDLRQAYLNPDKKFGAASIYKLLLTHRLFNKYSLDGLNAIQVRPGGRDATSAINCLDLMMKKSDNPCGEAVGGFLGWSASARDVKDLGLSNTYLNAQPGPLTTSKDVALYLTMLNDGKLMSPESTSYLLGIMQQQVFGKGIKAGCSGCVVADKTGDLGYVRHDAGIIANGDKKYVLSIFTNGAPNSEIAELTSKINAVMTAQ